MEQSNEKNPKNPDYGLKIKRRGQKRGPKETIFLDFDGFGSFPRPGYGYGTAEMPDMTPENTRFPWISLFLNGFS